MAEETGTPGEVAEADEASEQLDASKVQAAKKILQALTRAVATQRLYTKKNEVVRRSLSELAEAFEAYLGQFGTLRLQVESLEFRVGRETIHKDAKREDSIPHRLYRDGIREIVFMEGLTPEEIEEFADILKKEGGEGGFGGGEDLVSLLWKKDFSSIDYMAIDDISDQAASEGEAEGEEKGEGKSGEKGEGRGESSYRLHAPGMNLDELIPGLDAAAAGARAAGGSSSYKMSLGFVNLDDPVFRSAAGEAGAEGQAARGSGLTAKSDAELFLDVRSVPVQELADESRAARLFDLYRLTAPEREKIRGEIAADSPGRLCSMVCDLVFEMLGAGTGALPEESFAQILAPMLRAMLSQADFASISATLDALDQTSEGGFGAGAATRERILSDLASIESLGIAVAALASESRGKGRDFLAFLHRLPRGSIESLLALYAGVKGKEAGALIRDFVLTRAKGEPALLESLLGSEHDDLVEGALALIQSAKGVEFVPLLSKALDHSNQNVRMRSLRTLSEIEGAEIGDLLMGLLDDPVAEIRLLTLKTLSSRPSPRAAEALMDRVRSHGFDALTLPERTGAYQALAAAGADLAVSFLEEKLRKRSWFSRERTDEDRRLAALALGNIATPAAIAALERGESSNDKAIRGTCERALKRAKGIAG